MLIDRHKFAKAMDLFYHVIEIHNTMVNFATSDDFSIQDISNKFGVEEQIVVGRDMENKREEFRRFIINMCDKVIREKKRELRKLGVNIDKPDVIAGASAITLPGRVVYPDREERG